MPRSLIITEKPSVARDIVQALGEFKAHDNDYWESPDYLCTFAVGHILELLEPEEIDAIYKRWNLENLPVIPEQFNLKPKKGHSDRIKTIKKLMQRSDVEQLINACDAGREGELIFRELVKFLESKKPIRRLWLQSMTPEAIRDGFDALEDGQKFEGLAAAAECRAQADWLIGMNATRALTVRLRNRAMKGAWSAGRVQTPTLALLVERELEILKHIPDPYWQVLAQFERPDHKYMGTWFDPEYKADETKPHQKADRIFDKEKAEAIVAAIEGQAGLARETRKPSQESPRPLFDLTSLQREANSRFSWPAAKTLRCAQACYEAHKVLTYPRTSSKCLPSDYRKHVDKATKALSGLPDYRTAAQYLMQNGRRNEARIFDDKGVSDHFAIIPTGQISSSLAGDDLKLFDLVVRRFLAAFHPNAVWEQVERITVVTEHNFLSRSRTLREPGWRAVFGQRADEGEGEERGLPPLEPGQTSVSDAAVKTAEVELKQDQTRPPPRITEARLLSLMENAGKSMEDEDLAAAMSDKGLGTPATRADIIENLKNKEYVDRTLRPTAKGMRLIDLLRRIQAGRLTSAELTGELEMHLAEVEGGARQASQFMGEIIDYTHEIVRATRDFDYDTIYPNQDPVGVCPCEQKRPVYERSWFYRCVEDPNMVGKENDCQFRMWKDKSGRYIDRVTATTLLRDGRTGELDGFADRQGRTYKGILAIKDKEVVLEPIAGTMQPGANGQPLAEFEIDPEPLGQCPIHADNPDDQVIETPSLFVCRSFLKQQLENAKKPEGFYLPRIVCRREITRADALEYLQNGETPLIEDFISRFGRPFKAKLKRKPTGRHEFEFPPREPKKKKAATGEGESAVPKGRGRKKVAEASTNGEAPPKKKAVKKPAVKKKAAAKRATKKQPKKKAEGE